MTNANDNTLAVLFARIQARNEPFKLEYHPDDRNAWWANFTVSGVTIVTPDLAASLGLILKDAEGRDRRMAAFRAERGNE